MWLQISAGRGPAECAWAVVRTLEKLQEAAAESGVAVRVVELEPGPEAGTALSAVVALDDGAAAFAEGWTGTVQWIARSPFRPHHKRRNWFVSVEALPEVAETVFRESDVRWETMRASGPGGQHVNRTESSVRATHVPTGMQAVAAEERSQFRNRKLALARLVRKVAEREESTRAQVRGFRWEAHGALERGNAVRVFRGGEK